MEKRSNLQRMLKSNSREETLALGEAVGRTASGRLVIALIGDLGSGKTIFVKGLARGLDVPEAYVVTSPSYTLINEYPGRLPLIHADLYRLSGTVDIESTGLFDYLTDNGVLAIEWAERLPKDVLLEDIVVSFEIDSHDARRIRLTGCGQKGANLLRRLKF